MLITEPFNLGRLRLPSRLMRSATAEHMPPRDPEAASQLGDLYRHLAEGGIGLIVTGHVAVAPEGKANALMAGIWTDDQTEAWAETIRMVRETPCPILLQINHAGGRARPDSAHTDPVCVTPIDREHDPMAGRPLDDAGIEGLIEAFAHAARRAMDAGANGVQIHAAHGYLISQFLSPLTNHRDDHWGGDLEGRARFLLRVLEAVRGAVGGRGVIGAKIGAADGNPDGLHIEDTIEVARRMQGLGLDFVEISGAFHPDVIRRRVSSPEEEAYYLPWARRFKDALDIPVAAVGGFRSAPVIENALASGGCDLVSMARPLIRQPDLLRTLEDGGSSDCESDNRCLVRRDGPLECPLLKKEKGSSEKHGGP